MTNRINQALFFLLVMMVFICLSSIAWGFPQQDATANQAQMEMTEGKVEEIVPAPQNIKQATGIYVFIGWIWLCIAVLVYFLRLKVKEADRLFSLAFFSEDKE
jgi:hypothetical protein